jgi:hypothetical protein
VCGVKTFITSLRGVCFRASTAWAHADVGNIGSRACSASCFRDALLLFGSSGSVR